MVTSYESQIRVERVSFAPRGAIAQRSGKALIEHSLLKEVSFEVNRGDRVAIVGASGAGKTSLLRLLNRLIEPTSGAIYLEQQRFDQIAVIQLRRQVVLVAQESRLLGMTVQQTLEYPLVLQHLPTQVIQQRVAEWIERLQIPSDWLGRGELQLSVGQRQLVAIARALVMQPKVLLLDEPTSALDAGRSEFLIRELVNLAQTAQTTVLMVNHQLDLAKHFSSHILHLHQGKLVQQLPSSQMDWENLRDRLIQANKHQTEEWG